MQFLTLKLLTCWSVVCDPLRMCSSRSSLFFFSVSCWLILCVVCMCSANRIISQPHRWHTVSLRLILMLTLQPLNYYYYRLQLLLQLLLLLLTATINLSIKYYKWSINMFSTSHNKNQQQSQSKAQNKFSIKTYSLYTLCQIIWPGHWASSGHCPIGIEHYESISQ